MARSIDEVGSDRFHDSFFQFDGRQLANGFDRNRIGCLEFFADFDGLALQPQIGSRHQCHGFPAVPELSPTCRNCLRSRSWRGHQGSGRQVMDFRFGGSRNVGHVAQVNNRTTVGCLLAKQDIRAASGQHPTRQQEYRE